MQVCDSSRGPLPAPSSHQHALHASLSCGQVYVFTISAFQRTSTQWLCPVSPGAAGAAVRPPQASICETGAVWIPTSPAAHPVQVRCVCVCYVVCVAQVILHLDCNNWFVAFDAICMKQIWQRCILDWVPVDCSERNKHRKRQMEAFQYAGLKAISYQCKDHLQLPSRISGTCGLGNGSFLSLSVKPHQVTQRAFLKHTLQCMTYCTFD